MDAAVIGASRFPNAKSKKVDMNRFRTWSDEEQRSFQTIVSSNRFERLLDVAVTVWLPVLA